MRIADMTFGLDRYAWSLLGVLSTWEPDFAGFNEQSKAYDVRIQTNVYRNGVHNWGSLTMDAGPLGLKKVIAFGRCAYRDEIVVQSWGLTGPGDPENPESLEDQPSELHRYPPVELMRVARFIRDELAGAYAVLAQA